MTGPAAPISDVRASAYRIPTEEPEADGTLAWSHTEIIVVTVHAGNVVGLGWTYTHHCCVDLIHTVLAAAVEGGDVRDVPALWQRMQHAVRNHGRPGLVSCAMSAVDIAMWDAAARLVDTPLTRLLGRAHESVPVYASGGFTTYDDERLRDQLHRWVDDQGIPSVKIKIGESWGTEIRRDLTRVGVAREVVGDEVELYVDANGAYSVGQAVRVGAALDDLDVRWYEEPVSSDDLAGLRTVRHATAADVAAGEYGYHLPDFAELLDAEAVDCLQIDLTRCGGIGEWRRAAALAAARNREVSGHCAQNLALHVATATHNVRHLEWFHDHDRIERMLFDGVAEPDGGVVSPDLGRAGHGLVFKGADAERYRIRP